MKKYFGIKKSLVVSFLLLCLSGSVQAETIYFMCKNWSTNTGETKDTFFIGKTTKDGFIIRNEYKTKIELKFIGNYNSSGVKFYAGTNPKYQSTEVFIIQTSPTSSVGYNFRIKGVHYSLDAAWTHCNYE